MRIHRLTTVDGFIAFDLDDSPVNAGGTRYAPDVTEAETALLARAMTYKFGVLGRNLGGAKGGVRGAPAEKDALMHAYCEEIRPLVRDTRFLTGPDLGTSEADFAPLRPGGVEPSLMASDVAGVPLEDLLTGFGVAAAADAATAGLDGLRVAIEGFGKVGGGVAREVVRRGGRVVALSTIEGAVTDASGLDVELAIQLKREHGDGAIHLLGRPVEAAGRVFEVDADVLVPGARTGVITSEVAGRVRARFVVPAANAPYTAGGLDVLRRRGIRALADFVCNAGAVIGYMQPSGAGPGDTFREVERVIRRVVDECSIDPAGPFEAACRIAEDHIASWRGADGMPGGRPLATG